MDVLRFAPAQSLSYVAGFTGNGRSGGLFCRRRSPRISASWPRWNPNLTPDLNMEQPLLRVSSHSLPQESRSMIPNMDVGKGVISNGLEYLKNILSSKVYDVAEESPLELATKLSENLRVNVWVKREDYTFRLRGAYNMMANLPKEALGRGVISSSSTADQAHGVALSAQKLDANAVIVMPRTTPETKWRSLESMGVSIELVGNTYEEAQAHAMKKATEEGLTYIPPFDHPDIIAGQGTVGLEIMKQVKGPVEAIFVPVGGGDLISGIAAYVKTVNPNVKVIGVEPDHANPLALSFHHGQRAMLDHDHSVNDFALIGQETYRLSKDLIDGVILVNPDAISEAIQDMYEEKGYTLDPSGALAIAGAKAYSQRYGLEGGANVVAIIDAYETDLTEVGKRIESVFTSFISEKAGSLKQFYELVGSMDITELKYTNNPDKGKATVVYRLGRHSQQDLEAMVDRMQTAGVEAIDLSLNDLVRDHFNYLAGGRSSKAENEKLMRFVLPDKPGALKHFLDGFTPNWEMSMYHYQKLQGNNGATLLVGADIPDKEKGELFDRAQRRGYVFKDETNNEAFKLLM